MADEKGFEGASGAVQIFDPRVVQMYTVIDVELDAYEGATRDAQTAFGFFGVCAGAFLGALISAVTAWPSSPNHAAGLVAALIVTGLASLWFLAVWWSRSKNQKSLLKKIKASERKKSYSLAPITETASASETIMFTGSIPSKLGDLIDAPPLRVALGKKAAPKGEAEK